MLAIGPFYLQAMFAVSQLLPARGVYYWTVLPRHFAIYSQLASAWPSLGWRFFVPHGQQVGSLRPYPVVRVHGRITPSLNNNVLVMFIQLIYKYIALLLSSKLLKRQLFYSLFNVVVK